MRFVKQYVRVNTCIIIRRVWLSVVKVMRRILTGAQCAALTALQSHHSCRCRHVYVLEIYATYISLVSRSSPATEQSLGEYREPKEIHSVVVLVAPCHKRQMSTNATGNSRMHNVNGGVRRVFFSCCLSSSAVKKWDKKCDEHRFWVSCELTIIAQNIHAHQKNCTCGITRYMMTRPRSQLSEKHDGVTTLNRAILSERLRTRK